MIKPAVLAFLALIFLGGHLPAQTQAEMNRDAAAQLEAADAKLNRAYQAVLKKYAADPELLSDLKEAQRAWLKYVEFHLKTVLPVKDGEDPRVVYGSMYPIDYSEAKIPLLESRAAQLKSLVED